jgi:ketosteroid isomerase-like protein
MNTWGRKNLISALAGLLSVVLLAGAMSCTSGGSSQTASDRSPDAAENAEVGVAGSAAPTEFTADEYQRTTGMSVAQAERLIRDHLAAVGEGDVEKWQAALAADVRFDIGGAIYQGRDAARQWAERDPIGQKGRYEVLSVTATASGVAADVTFRAGNLVEDLRYVYVIRGGAISELVATYRR